MKLIYLFDFTSFFFLVCQKWVQFIFAHHLLLSKAEKQEIWSFFWNAHLCKWVQSSKVTNIISMLLEQFHHHHKCTLHILFLIPSFFNFFLPKMMDQISNRTHMLRIKEATYAKIRYYLYKSEAKEIVKLIYFCISRNFCELVPKLTTK